MRLRGWVQPLQHAHVPWIGDVHHHDRVRRLAQCHPGPAAVGADGEVMGAGAHGDASHHPHTCEFDAGQCARGRVGHKQVLPIRRKGRELW